MADYFWAYLGLSYYPKLIVTGDELELKNLRVIDVLGKDVTRYTEITRLSNTKYLIDLL